MTRTPIVYGPVPSHRLGRSLGLSIIPPKTCTLNCIYCQCGRTTNMTVKRSSFFPLTSIINQVEMAVKKTHPDFITLSGTGEPTLNRDIGKLLRLLKTHFNIPVAVITNSTLLTQPAVRRALYSADLVMPSLDAAEEKTFRRVNRPHPALKIEEIIRGLKIFRRYYRGKMWLEIMLIKGINDSPEHLMKLRRLTEEIKPDRVYLNTVIRPPAERFARALSPDDFEQIGMLFPNSENPFTIPVHHQHKDKREKNVKEPHTAILAFLRNRPGTINDIALSLGIPVSQIRSHISCLIKNGLIKKKIFSGQQFYEPA